MNFAPVCLLSEMFQACPAQTSGYNQGKLEKLCLQTAQGAPWVPMEKLKEVAAEKRDLLPLRLRFLQAAENG